MKTLDTFLFDCVQLTKNSVFLGLDLVSINSAIPGILRKYPDYDSYRFHGVTLNRETTELTVTVSRFDGDVVLKKIISSDGLSIPYELGRL